MRSRCETDEPAEVVLEKFGRVPEQVRDAAFLIPPRPGPDDQFAMVQQPGFAPRLFEGAGHFFIGHAADALGFHRDAFVEIKFRE